jgi:hypothetical protein
MGFLVRVIMVMVIGQWVKGLIGSVNGLSPEIVSPVDELAAVLIDNSILDNH